MIAQVLSGKPHLTQRCLFDSPDISKNSGKINRMAVLRKPGVAPQEKLNPRKYHEKIKEGDCYDKLKV